VFTFTISDDNPDNPVFRLSHVPLRPNYHLRTVPGALAWSHRTLALTIRITPSSQWKLTLQKNEG
jgi:hypothetical protein